MAFLIITRDTTKEYDDAERSEKASLKEWLLLSKLRNENFFFTGDTAVAKTMEEYWLFKEPQECKMERKWCRVTVVRQQAESADDLKNMEVL